MELFQTSWRTVRVNSQSSDRSHSSRSHFQHGGWAAQALERCQLRHSSRKAHPRKHSRPGWKGSEQERCPCPWQQSGTSALRSLSTQTSLWLIIMLNDCLIKYCPNKVTLSPLSFIVFPLVSTSKTEPSQWWTEAPRGPSLQSSPTAHRDQQAALATEYFCDLN